MSKKRKRRINGKRGGRIVGLEQHIWREKSEQKKKKKKKKYLWEMRGETFPELGGGCLEMRGCGHTAPGPASFYQLFFSLQYWCNQTGHRKSKGCSVGGFCCFVCVLDFFIPHLLILSSKQPSSKLVFLLVLPHDVNSFHFYRFCG